MARSRRRHARRRGEHKGKMRQKKIKNKSPPVQESPQDRREILSKVVSEMPELEIY